VGGNHGRGITVNMSNTYEDALVAFEAAKQVSAASVIIEKYIVGEDYRIIGDQQQISCSS
jgi:cyanophycin synthetase